ncbi:hypothetical protein [Bradyrhizobium sp. CCGE-LA001]|uniref:hypothetical protein n=1 Tax=Bradyrhizobium sp. CCGE-LA001 TaxID=1223566 RepID=UPI0002AAE5AF|nr:hypothetical protein [Bradyrhizobium sp. CCGE-LA001]AMA56831.1 hypothetical protein BCCGELA001_11635 [Bradyrhizobium sp. CCGE-LA001]
MLKKIEMPAREPRHQDLAVLTGDAADLARKSIWLSTSGWPSNAQDISPLAWWRTLPSDLLHDAEHLLVIDTLGRISMFDRDGKLPAAVRGDTAAAIGAALSLLPFDEVTLTVDITMTALLQCALRGDATSTVVLANILHRVELNYPLAAELSVSWYTRLARGPSRRGFRARRRSCFRDRNDHAEDRA